MKPKHPAATILNVIGEQMSVREGEFVRVRYGRSHSRRAFIARVEHERAGVRLIGNIMDRNGEWMQPRTIRSAEILCHD
jgi:hypothetical protein